MLIFRNLLASTIVGCFGMRQYYKSFEPQFKIKKSISPTKDYTSPEVSKNKFLCKSIDRLFW